MLGLNIKPGPLTQFVYHPFKLSCKRFSESRTKRKCIVDILPVPLLNLKIRLTIKTLVLLEKNSFSLQDASVHIRPFSSHADIRCFIHDSKSESCVKKQLTSIEVLFMGISKAVF